MSAPARTASTSEKPQLRLRLVVDAPVCDPLPATPFEAEGICADGFHQNEIAPQPATESNSQELWSDLLDAFDNVGKERPWFAEGAIEGCPIIMFAGPEKSHKSWTAMQLAVATVLGGKWLGRFQIMRPGPVVYLDGEYGPHEFVRRIARIARGMSADPREVLRQIRHLYSTSLVLKVGDPELVRVGKQIQEHKPALIVLDPLRNHLNGDENSAPVILEANKCLSMMRGSGGCPVLALHHLNKSGSFTGNRAITTRADLIIEGTDGETPSYTTRGRTVRQMTDPIAQPFTIAASHEHDDDDTIATTRIACSAASGAATLPPDVSEFGGKILAVLKKHEDPRTKSYIATAVGRSNGDTETELRRLKDARHVEEVLGGVVFKGKEYDGWKLAGTQTK